MWLYPTSAQPCTPDYVVLEPVIRLSDFTFTFHFHALEKEMATHSSVLAWRIPGTGEPGGLPLYGVAQSQTQLKRLSNSSLLIELSAIWLMFGEYARQFISLKLLFLNL